jgi:alpha-D-ribose 1-methylphosphonate 5-triphosphate synthase subunit PhnH
MSPDSVLLGGFAHPVDDSQRVFRALLDALSNPGRAYEVDVETSPPAPLTRGLAAVALTVLDADTSVWLDEALTASVDVAAWLQFHTGTTIVHDASAADFALVSSSALCPAIDAFSAGTAENPHLSATLVINDDGVTEHGEVTLSGPGIQFDRQATFPYLAPDFIAQWGRNARQFPRGVDLVFVGRGVSPLQLRGLPRTTSVTTVTGGN